MATIAPNQSLTAPRFNATARRYRAIIAFVVAAVVGLLLLPVVFGGLQAHDVPIGRLSLVDLVWIVLAIVASAIMVGARSGLARDLKASIERLGDRSTDRAEGQTDATTLGVAVANGLLNLVLLLVVQAVIRPPLVGLAAGLDLAAIVDSVFVILVVLIALGILVELRRASRPLTERMVRAGLDQLVPTAGFTTPSARTAFATRLATTTASRPPTPPRTGASAAPSGLPAGSAPSLGVEPPAETIAAAAAEPIAETIAASAIEPTVLAPSELAAPPVASVAETILAQPDALEATVAPPSLEATIAAPGPATEATIAAPPPPVEEPELIGKAEATLAPEPSQAEVSVADVAATVGEVGEWPQPRPEDEAMAVPSDAGEMITIIEPTLAASVESMKTTSTDGCHSEPQRGISDLGPLEVGDSSLRLGMTSQTSADTTLAAETTMTPSVAVGRSAQSEPDVDETLPPETNPDATIISFAPEATEMLPPTRPKTPEKGKEGTT